jgi:hypothetical protein
LLRKTDWTVFKIMDGSVRFFENRNRTNFRFSARA